MPDSNNPNQEVEHDTTSQLEEATQDIRARIIHTLQVFPYISRAMLQVALGPGLSPKFWDGPLQDLVNEGVIKLVETVVATPGGRTLTKGIYHLPEYPYPPVKVKEIEATT